MPRPTNQQRQTALLDSYKSKSEPDKSNVKQLAAVGKEMYKDDDKALKYIELAEKFAPVVQNFLRGFGDQMKAYNDRQGQQQAMQSMPQPPPGWNGLSSFHKLQQKYSNPALYEAGIAYDEWAATQGQAYYNPHPSHAPNIRRDVDPQHGPRSIAELNSQYPQDIVDEAYQQEQQNLVPKNEQQAPQNLVPKNGSQEQLVREVHQYINMAISYLKKMDHKEFKVAASDPEALSRKVKPYIPMIPRHVLTVLWQTPTQDYLTLFAQECPKKYKWLALNNRIEDLALLFDSLKREIGGGTLYESQETTEHNIHDSTSERRNKEEPTPSESIIPETTSIPTPEPEPRRHDKPRNQSRTRKTRPQREKNKAWYKKWF